MFVKVHAVNEEGISQERTLDLNLNQVQVAQNITQGETQCKRLVTQSFNILISLEEYETVVEPLMYPKE